MQPTDFEAGSGGGGSGVEACQLYAAAAAELMKQCEAVLATQGPLTCKKLPRLSRLALCAHAGVQEVRAKAVGWHTFTDIERHTGAQTVG